MRSAPWPSGATGLARRSSPRSRVATNPAKSESASPHAAWLRCRCRFVDAVLVMNIQHAPPSHGSMFRVLDERVRYKSQGSTMSRRNRLLPRKVPSRLCGSTHPANAGQTARFPHTCGLLRHAAQSPWRGDRARQRGSTRAPEEGGNCQSQSPKQVKTAVVRRKKPINVPQSETVVIDRIFRKADSPHRRTGAGIPTAVRIGGNWLSTKHHKLRCHLLV
jgi:hypothetical protein